MIDARSYQASETLRDGIPVTVRAIRPGDWQAVLIAFQELDPESVYTRFFTYKKTLADDELHRITDVDFDRVVALVVTAGDSDEQNLIGGARYVIIDDLKDAADRAELAFITSDAWRGRGVAPLLLRHLAQMARERGLTKLEANVLPQNTAMLAVFRQSGLPMSARIDAGVVVVSLSLER